jgi:hypothetical protein
MLQVWMTAQVGNGSPGTVYASARALFVAPRAPGEGLWGWARGLWPFGDR